MNERDKELAKQAGWPESLVSPVIMAKLKEFADSIRADEREACAKVVDAAKAGEEDWDSNDWNQAVEFCASRIRARGNT